jgi:DNA (cytosine-5)-methyltransferase 1
METSKTSDGETLFPLTLYVGDTPASRLAQQANGKAQTTPDTFGLGCEKPLASYDPDTQSWRTYEATLVSDSQPFSGKWPASGMTQNGKLFQQPQLVRHIAGIVSSSWPTPTVDDSKNVNPKPNRRPGLVAAVNNAPTPSGNWPTPTTADVYTDNLKSSQQSDGSMHSVSLGQAVQMWPTPTAVTRPMEGNVRLYRAKIQAGEMTEAEAEAILGKSVWEAQGKLPAMWPTPTHGKLAGGSGAFQQIQDKYEANEITLEEKKAMQAGNGGRLNPMWVEWLMGFPTGWTDLKD